jgi:hypothetical protein
MLVSSDVFSLVVMLAVEQSDGSRRLACLLTHRRPIEQGPAFMPMANFRRKLIENEKIITLIYQETGRARNAPHAPARGQIRWSGGGLDLRFDRDMATISSRQRERSELGIEAKACELSDQATGSVSPTIRAWISAQSIWSSNSPISATSAAVDRAARCCALPREEAREPAYPNYRKLGGRQDEPIRGHWHRVFVLAQECRHHSAVKLVDWS